MKQKAFILLSLLLMTTASWAGQKIERPKLVVGLVVDQMRWDYLYYYYEDFVEGGLKRLIDEGYSCENTMINYVPTVTGIGHASVYTGSTPALHGICGNSFFEKGVKMNCCGDPDVQTVGSDDMVELRIMDTNALTHSRTNAFSTTLYSIRDNMFYDPYDAQSFTIPGGHRFSVVLPVMTEERYPKAAETHSIRMGFEVK